METRKQSSIYRTGLLALLTATTALLGACSMPPAAANSARPASTVAGPAPATVAPTVPAATPTSRGPLVAADVSEAALKNGAYELRDLGKVQLSNGQYKQQAGSGSTQANQVAFVSSATGDLNGDGAQDAAVVLAAQTGGTGSFYSLVAVLSDGGARQAGTDFLGDRIRLQSLTIEQGQVVVRMLVAGPKDPLCCPSTKVARTYGLRSGSLVLLSETVEAPTPTVPTK